MITTQRFTYDMYLHFSNENLAFAEKIAERLSDEGVKILFNPWEKDSHDQSYTLKPIHEICHKMVAICSSEFIANQEALNSVKKFLSQRANQSLEYRPFIPIIIDNSTLPSIMEKVVSIDFRDEEDFELKIVQLILALDLDLEKDDSEKNWEQRLYFSETLEDAASQSVRRFMDDIAELYQLMNYSITPAENIPGGFVISNEIAGMGGFKVSGIVICKELFSGNAYHQVMTLRNETQSLYGNHKWICVAYHGFDPDIRTALTQESVSCYSHSELLNTLLPIKEYAQKMIQLSMQWIEEKWHGKDLFIRPNLVTETIFEVDKAMTFFAKWLTDEQSNFLVVLGDLGTGKSTLAQYLFYDMLKMFNDDPIRYPAPILIPLREVRKEISLEGVMISHFARHGLSCDFNRFMHLLRLGKLIIIFDGFDEMADRVDWIVTQNNFSELIRAVEDKGKVFLTCRTHYFKDRSEQSRLMVGKSPSMSSNETDLYRNLKQFPGADLVYLQEFDTHQIKSYLKKVRPDEYEADWKKIQQIHNLEELAHRPLLLDMIVNSLPQLEKHEEVNAANLYTIFTNLWIQREREKGSERVLDSKLKQAIVLQLSWWMWHEEIEEIHYTKLVSFLRQFERGKGWSKEDMDIIFREMMRASFLKRDNDGNFSFMHRSFMEFFLAKRIHISFSLSAEAILKILNTRRFDRKIVFFLTLLDQEKNELIAPLKKILSGPYKKNISENALQILYWSARINCNMENVITNYDIMQTESGQRIPKGAQLNGAALQDITLEGADLRLIDLTQSDLRNANLNYSLLTNARFTEANLENAKLEHTIALRANFNKSTIKNAIFNHSDLSETSFIGVYKDAAFINVKGLDASKTLNPEKLEPVVQTGITGPVNTAAISPDGVYIGVTTEDGLIYLIRIKDYSIVRIIEGDSGKVNSICFSPDGKYLIFGGEDACVGVWNIETGQLLHKMKGHEADIMAVAFAPFGQLIATASVDHTVRLWEVVSGRMIHVLSGHTDPVLSLSFSPQGNILASSGKDRKIRLWNVQQATFIRSLIGSTGSVTCLQFSPNGRTIISAGSDRMIRIWDVQKGDVVRSMMDHTGPITSLQLSPDSKIMVSASQDKKVCVWNIENGSRLDVIKGHTQAVTYAGFSTEGKMLVSTSKDKTIRFWDIINKKNKHIIKAHHRKINSIDFSNDNEHVAIGSDDNSLTVWHMNKKFSVFWNIKSDTPMVMAKEHAGPVTSVKFSRNGMSVLTGSEDRTVRLWDTKKGKPLHGHLGIVTDVCFLPDNLSVLSASMDRSVRIWDTRKGNNQFAQKGHSDGVTAIACSPNGKIVISACMDHSLYIWDTINKMTLHTLKGHLDVVRTIAFARDGRSFFSGGDDAFIIHWHVETGNLVSKLEGHESSIHSIAVSPDGMLIASGSSDNTVRIWHLTNGECLSVLKGKLGDIHAVTFSPNGKFLIAAGSSGCMQFWDYHNQTIFLTRYTFAPGVWIDLLPDGRFDASPEGLRYLTFTEEETMSIYSAEELVRELFDPEGVKSIIEQYCQPFKER